MTTYRNLHGRSIQSVSTNPTETVAEGQVWYNSTADSFKSAFVVEAWSSSGSLVTARKYLGGCGTQTAALAFGGKTTANTASTEEYNGSGFSAGGDLVNARRYLAGCGTQTAALAFGGSITAKVGNTEEYDGSSWSEQTDLSTVRAGLAGAGIQTAGLAFGGSTPSGAPFSTMDLLGQMEAL